MLVVDYSDPAKLPDLGEVDIPGTNQILDVAVQGNRALVVGPPAVPNAFDYGSPTG